MFPLSCSNCSHNPLQHGLVGLDIGYCTRHRRLLLAPGHSTCGQLLRRDLLSSRAKEEQTAHRTYFSQEYVQSLSAPNDYKEGQRLCDDDVDAVSRRDIVVEEVVSYGALGSKFATLAVLRRIPGARAEIAMHSLGRGYLLNCFERDNRWTAGLHLLFWTRQRIAEEPELRIEDLRDGYGTPRSRVNNMAIWQIVTLRLNTVDQIARQAQLNGDDVGKLSDFAMQAVSETKPGDGRGLLRWIGGKRRLFDAVLTEARYQKLHEGLRPPDSNSA